MTDLHAKLLDATARIYEESGYRGTTTRRIAALAGVNEVTVFRHFGSKDELIKAALRARKQEIMSVPLDPSAPDAEEALVQWAIAMHARMYEHRRLVRQLLGDATERPELAIDPCDGADDHLQALLNYLSALRAAGRLSTELDLHAPAALLVGALFSDAIWRDLNPTMLEPEHVIRASVAVVVRGIGVRQSAEKAA